MVNEEEFTIGTSGGDVRARVGRDGRSVRVRMGRVSFHASEVPVVEEEGDVIDRSLEAAGKKFTFCAATVGNPHCVILMDSVSADFARRYGPAIEQNPKFPNRTNVQFMEIVDFSRIRIEIWERGAGYTLASGSSSVAAAAAAYRTGRCGPDMTVVMPGGELSVGFTPDFEATMTGPVTPVYDGTLRKELLEEIASLRSANKSSEGNA